MQKEEAKALGARWDAGQKKWYAPEGKELTLFQAWLPRELTPSESLPSGTKELFQISSTEISVAPKGITLSELLAGVAKVVSQAFNQGVWTMVEVIEVRSKNGHVYLELSERTPDGIVLASARGAIWASVAAKILPAFEKATGASIAPGIKLLVNARPVFKPQYGFSLEIDAIDPEYTLGDLEARKREIRLRLSQEGIFDANKKLPSPWDYTHVLVVAPEGAAGLGDFQAEADRLARCKVCYFEYVLSRFQGDGAPVQIKQALVTGLKKWRKANESDPDAIVIIRGGGAVNDLAWLNEYELARTICELKIPVLTGIGHERDNTILDEIANVRFDTPSKVIAGIEQVIRKRVNEVKNNFDYLNTHALRDINTYESELAKTLSTIQADAVQQISQAKQKSSQLIAEVNLSAVRTIHDAQKIVVDLSMQIRHESFQLVNQVKQKIPTLMTVISHQADYLIQSTKVEIIQKIEQIRDKSFVDIRETRQSSTALFREILGQGPEKTLGRGFVIVKNQQGRAVTSKSSVVAGDQLNIQFRDGIVPIQVKEGE